LAVAEAGAADGLDIALHLEGHDAGTLAWGDRQDGPGAADLIPGQRLAAGDLLQEVSILAGDRERGGFSTTHGMASEVGKSASEHNRAIGISHFIFFQTH
jgi:hypothetical protein